MSYLKSMGTAIIYFGLFLTLITFLPGLPPNAEFKEYSIPEPHDLDPKVNLRSQLHGLKKMYVGEVVGPESFDSYDGKLYSTVHGGYVIKLEEDRVVPVVKIGEKCDGIWQEHLCGRPLGLKFDKKGTLYVVDAYSGIFEVNIATKEYRNIVNSSKSIGGKIPRIPNSLDIADNGDIYWTISSTDFYLYDGVYTFLANPSGRLIRYNAAERKNEVLLDNLAFANGIKLSDDESFLIVAETLAQRISKYYLKGPKKGQHEVLLQHLPGLPDNIHSDNHGGFIVTTVLSSNSNHPQVAQILAPHPYIRKMLARFCSLLEAPFKLLQEIYPNTYFEMITHWIGSFQMMLLLDTIQKSLLLRIDESGNIIEAAVNDTVFSISSAYTHNGYLWLGSPWLDYATRIPLKNVFPDLANLEKQPSRSKTETQPSKVASTDAKAEKVKRDTDSAKLTGSNSTPKKTATSPTTPKPIPAPVVKSKPNTAPPATPKPTAKADKPSNTDNNAKSSETKQASKPSVKKDGAKIVNDAKTNVKSDSSKVEGKPEINSKSRENTARTSTKSEKNVKVEQDVPAGLNAQKIKSRK